MPPSMKLTQELVETKDEEEAVALLEANSETIDENLLNGLMTSAEQLEGAGDQESAEKLRRLYKQALKMSMKAKMN